jgi:predicted dienelactone hydrolase
LNYKRLVVLVSLFIVHTGLNASGDVNLAISSVKFIDEQRMSWDGKHKRPIVTHLFYPTIDSNPKPILLGPPNNELFNAGDALWGAKLISTNKRPLIIMSHGTGGSALQMLWLADKLVKNGYLVVGVNHHGNTAIEEKKYAEGYKLWWERSQDIAVVLDKLSSHAIWSANIDQDKIGIIGFSLGGYTAISTLGGITDKSLFTEFCQSPDKDFTCEAQLEFSEINDEYNKVKESVIVKRSLLKEHDSFKIDAIKAAFVLAPAVAQAITKASLKQIAVPVSVVVGNIDRVAPAQTNGRRISTLIENAEFSELDKVGHYTFLSTCTDLGINYLKDLCGDDKDTVREIIHNQVSDQAVTFFNGVFSRH